MKGTRRKVPVSLNLARALLGSPTDLQVPLGLVTHLSCRLCYFTFPPFSPSPHSPFIFFSPNPTPMFTASVLFFELSLPRYICFFFLAFSHSLRDARFFQNSCILYNLHLFGLVLPDSSYASWTAGDPDIPTQAVALPVLIPVFLSSPAEERSSRVEEKEKTFPTRHGHPSDHPQSIPLAENDNFGPASPGKRCPAPILHHPSEHSL